MSQYLPPPVGRIWRSLSFVATWMFFAITSSQGPWFQSIVLGLLNGNATNIYDAATSAAQISFPDLRQHSVNVVTLPWMLVGLFLAVSTIISRKPQVVIFFGTMIGGLSLTGADLLTAYQSEKNAGIATLLTSANLLANLFGGTILIMIFLYICHLSEHTFRLLRGIQLTPLQWNSFIICIAAATFHLGGFYIFDFFLRVLPTEVRLSLSTSEGLSIFALDKRGALIPSGQLEQRIHYSSMVTPSMKWSSLNPKVSYDLEIAISSGCVFSEPPAARTVKAFKDVKVVKAGFSEGEYGHADFDSGYRGAEFKLTPQVAVYHWVKTDSEKQLSIKQFVDDGFTFDARNWDAARIRLTSTLTSKKDGYLKGRQGKFFLNIDGADHDIDIAAALEKSVDAAVNCKNKNASRVFRSKSLGINDGFATATFSLSFIPRTDVMWVEPTAVTSISGGPGWVEAISDKGQQAEFVQVAELQTLYSQGAGSGVIGEEKVELIADDEISVSGNLRLGYKEGKMQISSDNALFGVNNNRANKTKAELAGIGEIQTVLMGLGGVMGTTYLIAFLKRIQSNQRLP